MRRWMIVPAAALCVALLAGCLKVNVPKGPYVVTDVGASREANIAFAREFMAAAARDGVINANQLRELSRRLDAMQPPPPPPRADD